MDLSHTGLVAQTRSFKLGPSRGSVILVWALLTVAYLFVRIPLWNAEAPILSSLLICAELFGILSLALHIFCTWTLVDRRAPPPPHGARADILVTTWNEPVEMLRSTLVAAKAVRFVGKVWLLDDGARKEMKRLAHELEVEYLDRTDRSHAKAGNLNNALRHSNAEFVAVFDCDHGPSPDFLERTLGHFVDPKVAFVQTPQDFYNIDSFQHRGSSETREVWHEQTLFYRVIQPGKDRWNAAFFCGSCAVVRRQALDDIGGFATGTITEDLHTSLKLHKRGWRSVFHAEALAFGLSPSDFDQYQTQRLRWARGAMQVWVKEGFLFSRGLTLAQRLSYLASTSTYFEGWQKAIVYFMPIVVILTGWMPIVWAGPGLLTLFALWLLSGMIANEVVSRGYAKTLWMEEYNFFRYFTFIRATLALVIPNNWRFVVTPKGRAVGKSGLVKLLPQALIGGGALIALLAGSYLYFTRHHLPSGAFAVTLVFLTFDLILSGRALSFVLDRSDQRRANHRFPIPVPVTIERGGNLIETVAENVSIDGLLVHAPGITKAKTLTGTLHLPGLDLPFRSTVVRSFDDERHAVQFRWRAESDRDPLNIYLFGNTLQWDINSWSETNRTFFGGGDDKEVGRWQRAALVTSDGTLPCVARPDGADCTVWRVVSYTRPEVRDATKLEGQGMDVGGLLLAGCDSISVGANKVYICVLALDPAQAQTSSHCRPRWVESERSSSLPFALDHEVRSHV